MTFTGLGNLWQRSSYIYKLAILAMLPLIVAGCSLSSNPSAEENRQLQSVVNSKPADSEPPSGQTKPTSIPVVPPSKGDWSSIRTYLNSYVSEANIDPKKYATYDMLVLATDWRGKTVVSAATLKQIKQLNPNIFLIGYIGFGAWPMKEDSSGKPLDIYFTGANGKMVPISEYGNFVTDPRKPAFQDMYLNKYLPEIFSQFDGVFFDSLGKLTMRNASKGMDTNPAAIGAAELIKKLKAKFPDKKIIINNGERFLQGDELDVRGFIDGTMVESHSSTWASTVMTAGGKHKDAYYVFPKNSVKWVTSKQDTVVRLNKVRFEYNSDGTVQRDKDGNPVKSKNFFHVFSLDYVQSDDQTDIMKDALQRAWEMALVPQMRTKELSQPLPFDWRGKLKLPPSSEWGNGLDVDAINIQTPVIDDFSSGVGKWMGLIGEIDPLKPKDSASLAEDHGAAKLDFTVGGAGTANRVMLMSKGWYEPIDVSKGLKFRARLSPSLPAEGKSFLVELKDQQGKSRIWNLSGDLKTAWANLSIEPGDGRDGSAGLNPQKIVSIRFEIANTGKGNEPFSASLWIDDIVADND